MAARRDASGRFSASQQWLGAAVFRARVIRFDAGTRGLKTRRFGVLIRHAADSNRLRTVSDKGNPTV